VRAEGALMPFVVRIFAEDLPLWEEYVHSRTRYTCHVRMCTWREEYARIKVSAPAPLESLVGTELLAWINIDRSYLSKQTNAPDRIHIFLKRLTHAIPPEVRRLRLRIVAVTGGKVLLDGMTPED
jgi:hypothetical protein